jgi:hypothetical protein
MDQRSKLIAKEIEQKNPDIVMINGSVNPTFSSDTFIFILIRFGNGYYEIAGDGRYMGDIKKVDLPVSEWVINSISELHPDYGLGKFRDMYIVCDEDYIEESLEECERLGSVSLDYGGMITLVNL